MQFGICPTCGADRDLLVNMLLEGYLSDNWQIAIKIIQNCKECAKVIKRNLEWLCSNIP